METGGILYTSAFMERHLAKMRGVFSAVTSNGSVANYESNYQLQKSLVPKQLNALIKIGRIKGSFQAGRGQYNPAIAVSSRPPLADLLAACRWVSASPIAAFATDMSTKETTCR